MRSVPLGGRRGERGAAALEYVLVSTFAAVVTLAALGFVGNVVRERLTHLAVRLGVEGPTDDLGFDGFFGDDG